MTRMLQTSPAVQRRSRMQCSHRRRRGTILIMVIGVLVMLLLIGTAYVQFARHDRAATRLQTTSNTDLVMLAIRNDIANVVADDVRQEVDTDGDGVADKTVFLSGLDVGSTTDPDGSIPESLTEPSDYPYTNPNRTFEVFDIDGGSLGNAVGGYHDDMWLASTAPVDAGGGVMTWLHITNLRGVYLRLPKIGSTQSMPEEFRVDNPGSGFLRHDTDVRILGANSLSDGDTAQYQAIGVDADRDGIRDSRWMWASLPRVGGIAYVMAVRIIDNSSMVNISTATALSDGAGAYDALDHAPRWSNPAFFDLARFVQAYGGNPAVTEMQAFLKQLHDVDPDPGLPYRRKARLEYWAAGPRLYGNFNWRVPGPPITTFVELRLNNEREFRYGNGLNNVDYASPAEKMMGDPNSDFLRSVNAETSFTDVTNFYGGVTDPDDNDAIRDYFFFNPRWAMTTLSGQAIFAPRLPDLPAPVMQNGTSIPAAEPELVRQLNINKMLVNDTELEKLAIEIRKVIERPSDPNAPTSFVPPNDTAYDPDPATRNEQFANQFAANIKDYADEDSRLTRFDDPTVTARYGLEVLPFITEVYAQQAWEVMSIDPNTTDPNSFVDVTFDNPAEGYIIEIRNPFSIDASLADVDLIVDGTNLGALNTLPGVPNTLGPKEVLLLHSDAPIAGGAGAGAPGIGTEAGVTNVLALAGFSWPTGPVNDPDPDVPTNFLVKLQATATDGTTKVTYAQTPVRPLPDNTTTPLVVQWDIVAAPAPAVSEVRYEQRWSIGNGDGLNMLTIHSDEFSVNPGLDVEDDFDQTTAALGIADKTGKGGPAGEIVAGADNMQILIRNDTLDPNLGAGLDGPDRLAQIGELAHIVVLGPTDTQTIAEVWGAIATVDDLMLKPGWDGSPEVVDDTLQTLRVPHLAILMSRLTAESPQDDGEDNDGDGDVDEADEQFVMGKPNINTMPLQDVLGLILPVGDGGGVRTGIINAIEDYRDAVGRPAAYRQEPGIAHPAELFASDTLRDIYGLGAADNFDEDGTRIDFLNGPTPSDPSTHVADGFVDDREEKALWARYLSQMVSTRSDVFTAYIVVRGYPAGNFNKAPVEQAHGIAVFSRAHLTDGSSGPAKLLDWVEY